MSASPDILLRRVAADPIRPVAAARAPYFVVKRSLDFVVASATLLLLSPLLLLIAIAIKAETPGPALFAQQRLGGRRKRVNGEWIWVIRPFTMYKFRSMRVDADADFHRHYITAYLNGDESSLASLRPGRREGDSYRPSKDPRVTRVGAFLRKLSLDELPQLWNVVRGEMSLVGPRPPLTYEVEIYREQDHDRMSSLPGMTGWAQVMGRCTINWEEMVRRDLEYIARRSLWFDLKILLLTIPLVLSRRGAG